MLPLQFGAYQVQCRASFPKLRFPRESIAGLAGSRFSAITAVIVSRISRQVVNFFILIIQFFLLFSPFTNCR